MYEKSYASCSQTKMPKATEEQIAQMLDWSAVGMTHKQIAQKLGWSNATAERSVARYLKKAKEDFDAKARSARTLDEYTREERLRILQEKLSTTPRFRIVFTGLNADEKAMFEDEYYSIVKSTDSLTEAEEQTLFTAILSYVLAMRALTMKNQEENLFAQSMAGEIEEEDANYRRRVDERFQKEYESHMGKYNAMMKDLKMSRAQRLDKVKTERRTLVDVAEELSTKTAQADAAVRIEELSRLQDEELKRLFEGGHIFGEFVE